jgi:hypothetical protein
MFEEIWEKLFRVQLAAKDVKHDSGKHRPENICIAQIVEILCTFGGRNQ